MSVKRGGIAGIGEVAINDVIGKTLDGFQVAARGKILEGSDMDVGCDAGQRKRLREFAGLSPHFPPVNKAAGRNNPDRPVAERRAERKAVWPNSPTGRYLTRKRWLPSATTGSVGRRFAGRPGGGVWFPHLDGHGVVSHVDVRGPTYKGSLTGGAKSLFRLPPRVHHSRGWFSSRRRSTR